ncbi:helix-turn-helix domain-containing protein [Streptomyces sp. NPDC001663]|uniref:helix-turn-helix domain-containing protein n=1 Tax=Streptomyces sp. NPDC001663 TaxID=3364597 RepID=UPI0036A9E6CF
MGHNGELGDFLRSRRALLTPDTAGLPPGAGRAGCPSPEEVAPLAGVTTDYTRLEQGRHPHLSEAVLASVPHALRLDDECGYLFALTRPASHRPVAPAPRAERTRSAARGPPEAGVHRASRHSR